MAYELERRQRRQLEQMSGSRALARGQITTVSHVTQAAITETMLINLTRREAEQAAPDGAEQYSLLAYMGVRRMAQIIADLEVN